MSERRQRVNDMSPWTRWVFVAVVLLGAGYWFYFGPGQTTVAAWRVQGTLDPAATRLPLLVQERECASGQSAEGRIERPDVEYRSDAVIVTVRVRDLGGDQDCPGNPDTPFVLRLDEPVGDRELLDGGKRPPAPPGR